MQYLAKCDLIVYDLHFGNPRDVETALQALAKPAKEEDEERPAETVLILISSLLAWDMTPKKLQEIIHPDVAREIAAARAAEEKARLEAEEKGSKNGEDDEEKKSENEDKEDSVEESPVKQMSEHSQMSGVSGEPPEGVELDENGDPILKPEVEESVKEESFEIPVKKVKPKYVHHPFTEKDYQMRAASEEMQRIKEIEDAVLNFKKEGVKTYVISCGVLYGQGEEVFNTHFKKAWLQDPQRLPVVGEGENLVPTIHVTDLARMVKKVHEAPPEEHPYIFGIDNTKKPTQKKLI